ncbi:MAG: DUF4124 domain-containing protein [Betaproteobacteria bacterium]|nr:DUF4124 domain-containing protein [Betaproteobacteria bacterium]
MTLDTAPSRASYAFILPLAFFLAIFMGSGTAQAQIYKYKDASGHTVISDVPPPPGSATDIQSSGTPPAGTPRANPNPGAAPPAGTPHANGNAGGPPKKSIADQDLDFKKRLKDQQDKEEKEKQEQEAAARTKQNCDLARNELGALESGARVMQRDEKGERSYLDDNQRAQESERLRKVINDSCVNN